MPHTDTHSHPITTRQVAERFKVSRFCVYNWRTTGQLASASVDGQVRFTPADVDAFAASRNTL